MNLRDAFYPGELYSTEVPASKGLAYSESKRKILELVPMGGYWKDLPVVLIHIIRINRYAS